MIKLNFNTFIHHMAYVLYVLLAYLWISFFSIAHATLAQNQTCSTTIQSIHAAQGSGVAHEQYHLKNWHIIQKLPDKWTTRWPEYSGVVWYKINWISDCKTKKQPVSLIISSISMAGEVYINDDLIWQSTSLEEPLSRSWYTPRQWSIPASHLKEEANVTWVKVVGLSSHLPGLGQVYIQDSQTAVSKFNTLYFETKTLNLAHFVMNVTLLLMALFAWAIARKESTFGWYALNGLCWGLYLFNAIHTEPIFGLTTLQYERWINSIFVLYVIAKCLFSWRFIGLRFPKLERFLAVYFVVVITGNLFITNENIANWFQITFTTAVVIFLANCTSFIFLAYRRKRIEGYLLAINYLIYIPLAIHDALWVAGIVEGNPSSIYAAPIATIFVATLLGWKLAQNFKRIEKFNETLESTVLQVKEELSTSLHNAHQLELENTKLQERMSLAHDLHDGLGGSMVRSMALVEQSQGNLTNQQFLSMIKLLRDDLRQIIDYGSSSNARLPENPVIWIAPLRHRFNQIFDELDIQATWEIPNMWAIDMDAMDCLTYQRVLEESLTNVLKHSHANQVKISLIIDSKQKKLRLMIEDNGIGFNVSLVNDSGISVGLRSMQIRLEKIKANMHIKSEAGHTQIQVIKNYNA